MAEKIVSPGVFTNENDLSFLPQGIAEIGAAIIGPTQKGPAFVPTVIESQNDYTKVFGDGTLYTNYAVKSYLRSAGQVTVVRVLGREGYSTYLIPIQNETKSNKILAILAPTRKNPYYALDDLVIPATDTVDDFVLEIPDSSSYSASFTAADPTYITKVFGTDPLSSIVPLYVYANFSAFQSASAADDTIGTGSAVNSTFGAYGYASTPWVKSQDFNGTKYNLFRFHTISDGTYVNTEIKVGIFDVKFADEVPGSDYGTFGVVVREYGDTDQRQVVLETFSNMSMDPDSTRYYARVIGDKYPTVDSDGIISYTGDWDNKSKYIRVESYDLASGNTSGSAPAASVPFGFDSYSSALNSGNIPGAYLVKSQSISSLINTKAYFGVDFINATGSDLLSHFGPIPNTTVVVSGSSFNLSDGPIYNSVYPNSGSNLGSTSNSSSLGQRKFIMGFQGGFDGKDPRVLKLQGADITAGNTQGYDCTDSNASGTVDYRKALDAISNPDEIDVNLIVMPGIIYSKHASVANYAIQVAEDRADCFYLMDSTIKGEAVADAVDYVESLDTNYAATYYPWVRINDPNTTKPIWVPPSVVMAGVYAFNDSIAYQWYAPAGLNRGGIPEATDVERKLSHDNRDTLYEGRVNPIASFPGEGIVAWGQKTLQVKPSALDRVNVRRLLIAVRKYIASTSRYLVFEQNTAATRNRFLNIVNPYLESVQQRSGLTAFKVVMDETNNTPDIIDRNQLYGQIWIKPTRTAEFIVLDFNILPTGATFPE